MKDGPRIEPWGTQQEEEPVESFTVFSLTDKMDSCVTLTVPDTHTLPKTSNYWFIQSTSITVSERFSRPQGMKPLRKMKADWDPDRLPFWHHLHVLSYHHHNQKDGETHICPVLFASCYWEGNRNQSVLFRTNNKYSRSAKGIWESRTTAAFSFFFFWWVRYGSHWTSAENQLDGKSLDMFLSGLLRELPWHTCCIKLFQQHFSQQKRSLSCWYMQKLSKSRNYFL